jgi:hypothetical protein
MVDLINKCQCGKAFSTPQGLGLHRYHGKCKVLKLCETFFFCPKCESFEIDTVNNIGDFDSMACLTCGFIGDIGEDFPTRGVPHEPSPR